MIRKIEAGRAIYRQDRQDRKTFVIEQGLVKQTLLNLDGDEIILWIYGAGSVLGLPSEQCNLTAMQDSRIRMIDLSPADLLRLTESRLRRSERRLLMLSTSLVSIRLAHALLQLTKEIDSPLIPTTKEELAQLIGTTLFTVSRVLSKWQRDGIVQSGRCEVRVMDRERLAQQRESTNSRYFSAEAMARAS